MSQPIDPAASRRFSDWIWQAGNRKRSTYSGRGERLRGNAGVDDVGGVPRQHGGEPAPAARPRRVDLGQGARGFGLAPARDANTEARDWMRDMRTRRQQPVTDLAEWQRERGQ